MHDHDLLDCSKILEGLSDYIDGDAAPEICRQIKAHLEGCSDCDNFVETVKKVVIMYRSEKETMTEEARMKLHKILEEQCRDRM